MEICTSRLSSNPVKVKKNYSGMFIFKIESNVTCKRKLGLAVMNDLLVRL
jgi:hypothetical protein